MWDLTPFGWMPLDSFWTIQGKTEVHRAVHTSPSIEFIMQPVEIHFSPPVHQYTSVNVHIGPYDLVIQVLCLTAARKSKDHRKETQFLQGRDVGLLSFTLSGTLLDLSWTLHTGCHSKLILLYSFTYPWNVCVPLLFVKSFSSQLWLIFGESAIAICYTKNISFYCFLKQFMKLYLTPL